MATVIQFRPADGRLTERARLEELRSEVIAMLDEVIDFSVTATPVVNEWSGNVVKLGRRAMAAKAEVLSLGGGDAA